MKTKFAAEKSAYAHLLEEVIHGKLSITEHHNTLIKMRTIEELIKAQDDKIITVVSTENTYDGPPTAPPMERKKALKEVTPTPSKNPNVTNKDQLKKITEEKEPCCKHQKTSHGKKGCRYCDCKEERNYDE